MVKQISVFVENKSGRLSEIAKVLADNNIDIRFLSVADTSDFGILRMITNDPEKAAAVLKASNFTASITEVVAVKIEDKPGAFAEIVKLIAEAGMSIDYMYSFISSNAGEAYLIMRVENIVRTTEILKKQGVLIADEEVHRI